MDQCALHIVQSTMLWSRVGNFRQKNYSAEDGIYGTNDLFRRNSGCSAEQKTIGIPFRTIPRKIKMLGIPFHWTEIQANFWKYVLFYSTNASPCYPLDVAPLNVSIHNSLWCPWTCSFYNNAAACAVPRHGQVCSTAVSGLYSVHIRVLYVLLQPVLLLDGVLHGPRCMSVLLHT
jgi:hypothetical protein